MKTTDPVDAARLELMLTELRLPAIKLLWSRFADQADKEGWPAARFLAALSEHEIANATGAASSGTSSTRGCWSARPWRRSTSTPCPWSARPRSWRSRPATAGLKKAPI